MAVLMGLFFGWQAGLISLVISSAIYCYMNVIHFFKINLKPEARSTFTNAISGATSSSTGNSSSSSPQGRNLGSNIRTMSDLPPEPKSS
jgi:hypothetical protein